MSSVKGGFQSPLRRRPFTVMVASSRTSPRSSLIRAPSLAAIAQAKRMARAGEMSHLIGFNDSFGARMKGHGVPLPAAENIAAGQDTVERAVQAWIDSKRHLDNMLGGFNGLGVAVAWDSASGNRPYWAMVLSA